MTAHVVGVYRDEPRPDHCWVCLCGDGRVGYLTVDNARAAADAHLAKPPVERAG